MFMLDNLTSRPVLLVLHKEYVIYIYICVCVCMYVGLFIYGMVVKKLKMQFFMQCHADYGSCE